MVKTMRSRRNCVYFLLLITTGCAPSAVPRPVQPTPLPSTPNPVPSAAGAWTINRSSGVIAYQISRSAAIESQSDSSPHREISTNRTHELVTLNMAGDTIHFTAIIDTSSSTTQGTIGPVQSIQLPVQLSGSVTGDSLTISTDSTTEKCNPVSSALSADLHNLLVGFPIRLSQASSWRDSLELSTCQGMIPTTVRIARSYVVSGETTYQGLPVVVVQRRDSIHGHGEGAQQQHRVTLDASGTGNAAYYLNPQNGFILRLNTEQNLDLTITTSGKIHRFTESSTQNYGSVR
jgi:hypothetical protein